jgi:hypothetical protein
VLTAVLTLVLLPLALLPSVTSLPRPSLVCSLKGVLLVESDAEEEVGRGRWFSRNVRMVEVVIATAFSCITDEATEKHFVSTCGETWQVQKVVMATAFSCIRQNNQQKEPLLIS